MKVIFMLLVPFLGLCQAHAQDSNLQVDEVTVVMHRPMNMHIQEDGSHRLFYSAGRKYFFHPAGGAATMDIERSMDLCVLRTLLTTNATNVSAAVARGPRRIDFENVTTGATAYIHIMEAPGSGVKFYHSHILFAASVLGEPVALTCISQRPFTAAVYNEILGEGITVLPKFEGQIP